MRRAGFTLHEMLISLAVMSGVLGLAAHVAVQQMWLIRGMSEIAGIRGHVSQASAIAERLLWGVSPSGGDVVEALDSALHVLMPIGSAVVCSSSPGRVVVPAPTPARGATLAVFPYLPEPGDRVAALFADSAGTTWLTLHVAQPPVLDSCPRFAGVSAAWAIRLIEPMEVPAGAVLRLARPARLSLYRASDDRWYMGIRDWNEEQQRFNTIQPVAGPLLGYSRDPASTGLLFVYADADGHDLASPTETARIARITIVTRAASSSPRHAGAPSRGAFGDSTSVTVALRNSR